MTSTEYMNCVTTVDPYWLAEMGEMFFWIKEEINGKMMKKPKLENLEGGVFKAPMPVISERPERTQRSFRSDKDSSVHSFSSRTSNVVEAGNQLKSPIVRKSTHHNI